MTEYIERQLLLDAIQQSMKSNPHSAPVIRRTHNHEHQHFLLMVSAIPAADVIPTPRWISDSERLPEDFTDVLVYFEYYRYGSYNCMFQTIGISYTVHGGWSGFVNGQSGWRDLKILYWMPLPKLPKDVEHG